MSDKREYTKKEAASRFDAALRGAFKTPHKPLKAISPKQPKKKQKRGKSKSSA